jgi:hypothetical protein
LVKVDSSFWDLIQPEFFLEDATVEKLFALNSFWSKLRADAFAGLNGLIERVSELL